jgi:hypothetical protein
MVVLETLEAAYWPTGSRVNDGCAAKIDRGSRVTVVSNRLVVA